MEEPTRRAIAYAAALQIAGVIPNSIYSHETGEHTHMTESYDFETASHLSNMRTAQIFLHGSDAHVVFKRNGGRFSGFDHGSNDHYIGWVKGRLVTIFDHGTNEHHQYQF
ncbi:hypothetical protein [Aureimonas psammosilenae]|uniref:hypothetical protein n=1 Tax=Aureimonas psammosilenae TaxID=2495496 RepID=UPI0012611D4C|nr:hypothetical protein [Aureimonas psammosilenae]